MVVHMSRFRRRHIPGASVFFTVALAERGAGLLVDNIGLLRASVRRTLHRRPVHIDAWVVLPDHMHCLWTLPEDDADYSQRWGTIKAHFSKHLRLAGRALEGAPNVERHRLATAKSIRSAIWQPRFQEHHIRDRADYDAHRRFCWLDPVKHGLAANPADWPFSSVHRDMRVGAFAA